jgi:hypothetical protein
MAELRRMDIGFAGGQVLAVRAPVDSYDALIAAMGDDHSERLHTLETDDSEIRLDLAQVVYIRRERGDQKVGF